MNYQRRRQREETEPRDVELMAEVEQLRHQLSETRGRTKAAIRYAIEQERMACAELADSPMFTANETDAVVAKMIAIAIRNRGKV